MNDAPENAKLFQQEVQLVQGLLFGPDVPDGPERGVESIIQSIKGVVHEPLGNREAVGFGKVGGAIQRPREQVLNQGENGRSGRVGHRAVRRGYFTLADLASVEILMEAARRARRNKSRKPDVEEYFHKLESNIMRLHETLMDGTWHPGEYRQFWITDPKRRLISAAPFGDRVAHHALCLLLEPLLARRFIARSFSCQKGKGTTAARECVRTLVNRHRYVLKCDIRKFFESIDHEILLARLDRAVHCPGVRRMMRLIVDSHTTPGRDRPCGLPLGNLTSQLWANFFLDPLDHWITETMQNGPYARYTDDFLIFGDDKAALRALREDIAARLAESRLEFAPNKTRVMATREGVPFCGFVFSPGLRPRVLGVTKRRFEARRRRLVRRGEIARLGVAVRSWYPFSREGNSEGLRRVWSRPQRGCRP
jgi:RNA-directed DNA polymerase